MKEKDLWIYLEQIEGLVAPERQAHVHLAAPGDARSQHGLVQGEEGGGVAGGVAGGGRTGGGAGGEDQQREEKAKLDWWWHVCRWLDF